MVRVVSAANLAASYSNFDKGLFSSTVDRQRDQKAVGNFQEENISAMQEDKLTPDQKTWVKTYLRERGVEVTDADLTLKVYDLWKSFPLAKRELLDRDDPDTLRPFHITTENGEFTCYLFRDMVQEHEFYKTNDEDALAALAIEMASRKALQRDNSKIDLERQILAKAASAHFFPAFEFMKVLPYSLAESGDLPQYAIVQRTTMLSSAAGTLMKLGIIPSHKVDGTPVKMDRSSTDPRVVFTKMYGEHIVDERMKDPNASVQSISESFIQKLLKNENLNMKTMTATGLKALFGDAYAETLSKLQIRTRAPEMTASQPLLIPSPPLHPQDTKPSDPSQLPRENKRNIILNILKRFKQLIVPRKSQ